MIIIPALKPLSLKAIQNKWSWVKSIERDTSVTKKVEVGFFSVLQGAETYISSTDYQERLKGRPLLGFQHALWLQEHQDEFRELQELRASGVWYIDFPGTIVVGGGGGRCFPYLGNDGERFRLYGGWVGIGFSSDGRVAGAGQVALGARNPKEVGPFDPSDLEARIDRLEVWKERITKA